jgi:hypothetical protein
MLFYTCSDCHCLGMYTVILLSLLSFSFKLTVSPWATMRLELSGPRSGSLAGKRKSFPRERSR